ncbi:hypothetical protein D9M70_608240 [compost metagenome]
MAFAVIPDHCAVYQDLYIFHRGVKVQHIFNQHGFALHLYPVKALFQEEVQLLGHGTVFFGL